MRCSIPEPLKLQHEEIQEALSIAVRGGGKIGIAAKAVTKAVGTHFAKEEKLVLPLLGLLQPLAKENTDKSIEDSLPLIDIMRDNLMVLHDEHKSIIDTLKPFIQAAKGENRQDYLRFAVKLLLHVREEKELIFPTAILIANYLKQNMSMQTIPGLII